MAKSQGLLQVLANALGPAVRQAYATQGPQNVST